MQKTILIVDDSSTVREQLRRLLEADGFRVREAPDGLSGAAAAAQEACDLIIADINMPGQSGLDMIAEVRRDERHRQVPIFVLTTECTPEMLALGKEAGATAWIVKPFKAAQLLKGIHHVLGGP